MEKRYGANERNDRLMQIGRNKWELIYGYGTDGISGWTWRERFAYKPTDAEIKNTIIIQINKIVDEVILNGFRWNDLPVYLSTENQFNFKAAYDIAEMSGGATLPVKFKLGEDETGQPQYWEFTSLDDFRDFYSKALNHVNSTLNAGWEEKDGVDWSVYEV